MLRLYGLSLLSLSVAFVAAALAVPISIHDRGPCPNAADGVCVPNRRTYGYYSTKWRPWPGRRPPSATKAGQRGLEGAPHDTQPYELPPVEEEDTFGQPGGPPLPGVAGPAGKPPAAGQPPAGGGAVEGDLPPKPPLDSEDAPPVPPPSLQGKGPAAAPARGAAPPPTTPGAGPPLGGYRHVPSHSEPTSGQRTADLVWKQRTRHVPATHTSQHFTPIPHVERQPAANPLRAGRRIVADSVASRPAPVARQVTYTVPQPHIPQPAAAPHGWLRPNPLRQQP
jgi:hypothetical protein